MNVNADLLAILDEIAAHLERLALLDVLQNLRVARFEAHDQQAAAGIRHGLQRLVISVDAGRAGPLEADGLEFLAESEDAILANVERIVVKEEFLGLRKHFVSLAEFPRDALDRSRAPRVAGKRLRPQAESTQGRTSSRRIERNEWVQQERHIVFFDFHVFLVDVRGKGKFVQLGSLHQWPRGVVHNFAVLHVARVRDF